MYIQLLKNHWGSYNNPIKHMKIDCKFSEIYLGEGNIDEELLLKHIPEGWLPDIPENILLAVSDRYGTIMQYNLNKFRPYASYIDSYCLELRKDPLCWWQDI